VAAARALLEVDPSSTKAASAIINVSSCSMVTPQLASEGYLLLFKAEETHAAAAVTQKLFIEKTFPLCKLHTNPLTANEVNNPVLGPEDVETVIIVPEAE